jgi:hypothetical protein
LLKKPLHHLYRQFRFGPKAYRVWDACCLASIGIFAPVQRQIQFPINQAVTMRGDVREENTHLTVLDLPSGSTILQADASRILSTLFERRLINGNDSALAAQVLHHVRTQVITDSVRVPDRAGEQALHAIWTCFSGVFSQLPAVFARRLTHDALQIGQCSATRLGTDKTRGDTAMQVYKALDPTTDISRGRSVSTTGGLLIWLHEVLLSHEHTEEVFLPL